MFVRVLPDLCRKMQRPRKSERKSGVRSTASPDFYKINKVAPIPGYRAEDNQSLATKSSMIHDASAYLDANALLRQEQIAQIPLPAGLDARRMTASPFSWDTTGGTGEAQTDPSLSSVELSYLSAQNKALVRSIREGPTRNPYMF